MIKKKPAPGTPYIVYGVWSRCAKNNFEKVFKLQKKIIRIISKLSPRKWCRNSFWAAHTDATPPLYAGNGNILPIQVGVNLPTRPT